MKAYEMTDRGWCPFATQHRQENEGPFGYPEEELDQNHPVGFIHHRMGGYKRTLDSDDWRHSNGVGVTFGIGRDGSADQYTNIFNAHWGNGVSGDRDRYDRSNAMLADIEQLGVWVPVRYAGGRGWALVNGGINMINASTISMEHEDENEDQPWPDAMIDTSIRVMRWCLGELAAHGRPMPVRESMLAGHFQIDAVNRPGCPGDYWPRERLLAGIMEEDDMAERIWCAELVQTWILGKHGAAPVAYPVDDAIWEALYGPHARIMTAGELAALKVPKQG